MQNKIVISPTNKKAIAFFDDLNKKKAQKRQEIANSPLVSKIREQATGADWNYQVEGDAFEIIKQNLKKRTAFFFIDPPYTVAGKRLYTYYDIDHERLFALASRIQGKFMLTYDDAEQIRSWADKFNLKYRTTPMKTTHHLEKN